METLYRQDAKRPKSIISFSSKPYRVNNWIVLRLPEAASSKLPSRGQVMIEGTINNRYFKTPLEPDGKMSHWFRIDNKLQRSITFRLGDTLKLDIEPSKEWSEPEVPIDMNSALKSNPAAYLLWKQITTMARWEWIRWIRSTGSKATRQRRIEVAIAKLEAGKRRPCCWNRNLSSEPTVSKNGVLLEPDSLPRLDRA